jgi:hypothetical protein
MNIIKVLLELTKNTAISVYSINSTKITDIERTLTVDIIVLGHYRDFNIMK